MWDISVRTDQQADIAIAEATVLRDRCDPGKQAVAPDTEAVKGGEGRATQPGANEVRGGGKWVVHVCLPSIL